MATVNQHLQLLDQLYVYNRFNCETPAPGSDPENKIFMVPTFSSKPVKLLTAKELGKCPFMKTSGASRVLKYLELPSFFIPIF
jgi:hypothetical protein